MLTALLIGGAVLFTIILVIGIIRVIMNTPDSPGGFILDILCIDILIQILMLSFEVIGELLD